MRTEFIRLFYTDNTTLNVGTAGDVIASDDIGGVKFQRVKLIHGPDGTNAGDISQQNPLPVTTPDSTAAGNITAADVALAAPAEDGIPVSGTPTANSYVGSASPGGDVGFTIQLLGTLSGTYWFEISFDSTNGIDGNWIPTKAKQAGRVDEVVAWKTTLKGIYRGNMAGATYVRVRNIGGTSFTTNVTITTTSGVGGIFMTAPLPEGIKNIGRVSIAESFPPNPQQLAIEGYPVIGSLQQTTYGTLIAQNATLLSGTIQLCDLGAGKAAWVEEIVFTATGGCPWTASCILYNGSFALNPTPSTETIFADMPMDGGAIVKKIQRPYLEGSKLVVTLTALDTGRRPTITIDVRGVSFTDDFNFDAKTLALMIGTSCDGGFMGIDPATSLRYRNEWLHMYQVRDKVLDAKKSMRFINKAIVGGESDMWAKMLTSGIFGGTNYDLLIVNLGTNDAITGSGITTTQFETNLKKFITHRNRYRPEASIIFMDPTPTDTAIRSGIAAYRTSVANVANDATLGGTVNRVYMCSVFAQWVTSTGQATGLNPTATADANFLDTERSAGNREHPSGAGMNITTIALWATVQTTHFYKNLA
jgi:hypothetical protein